MAMNGVTRAIHGVSRALDELEVSAGTEQRDMVESMLSAMLAKNIASREAGTWKPAPKPTPKPRRPRGDKGQGTLS